MTRPFRFGVALANALDDDPVAQAVRADALGFDVVVQGDHIGAELSPMLTLAAVAQATERIRLASMVINADLRTPTQLAWEAVTLDHLSHGRFELGVGAGHTPQEYGAVGVHQEHAEVRKRRLMEFVQVVRRLIDGETVDHAGEFFNLRGAHVGRSVQRRLPLLVGGNGERLLEHAGRHADIIGLQGLGRTLDGHRHDVLWSVEHLERQIEHVGHCAGARMHDVELSALVQLVEVTSDRPAALERICARVDGLDRADADVIPYLLVGTVDEIAGQLQQARQWWGLRYFVVRDAEAFAPVIETIRNDAT